MVDRRNLTLAASALLILLVAAPYANADASSWIMKMLLSPTYALVEYIAAKIAEGASNMLVVMAAFIQINPCVYSTGTSCPDYQMVTPKGSVTWSMPLDPGIRDINVTLMQMLQLWYIFAIVVVGAYLIFMAGSPHGRSNAKDAFIRLIIGMILVSQSPVIFQFMIDLVKFLTESLMGEVGGGKDMSAFFKSTKFLCSNMCLLLTAVSATFIAAIRYFMVYAMASLFPLTLFLYFTDIPNPFFSTRGLGTRLLRFTILLFIVQLLQVVFIAVAFALTQTSGGGFVANILDMLLIIGAYFGVLYTPMIGLKLMAWVGAVLHLYSTRGQGDFTRFIATWMRTGRISNALVTASGQYMIGHNMGDHAGGESSGPSSPFRYGVADGFGKAFSAPGVSPYLSRRGYSAPRGLGSARAMGALGVAGTGRSMYTPSVFSRAPGGQGRGAHPVKHRGVGSGTAEAVSHSTSHTEMDIRGGGTLVDMTDGGLQTATTFTDKGRVVRQEFEPGGTSTRDRRRSKQGGGNVRRREMVGARLDRRRGAAVGQHMAAKGVAPPAAGEAPAAPAAPAGGGGGSRMPAGGTGGPSGAAGPGSATPGTPGGTAAVVATAAAAGGRAMSAEERAEDRKTQRDIMNAWRDWDKLGEEERRKTEDATREWVKKYYARMRGGKPEDHGRAADRSVKNLRDFHTLKAKAAGDPGDYAAGQAVEMDRRLDDMAGRGEDERGHLEGPLAAKTNILGLADKHDGNMTEMFKREDPNSILAKAAAADPEYTTTDQQIREKVSARMPAPDAGIERPLTRPTVDEIMDEALAEDVVRSARINGDEIHGMKLTNEMLLEHGMQPRYRIDLGEERVWLSSEAFVVHNERRAVIAYVERGGETFVRTYYRSNSQDVWRYLPEYRLEEGEIKWYSKAFSEDSITLPISIQKALAKIPTDEASVRRFDDPRMRDVFFAGTAKKLTGDRQPGFTLTEINQRPDKLEGSFYGKVSPENIVFSNPDDRPDFNAGLVDGWVQRDSPIYGETNVEVFQSKNGRYAYMMCSDGEGRAWVGGVEDLTSPITSTGLRKNWIYGGNLNTPVFEYDTQDGGYGGERHPVYHGYKDMMEGYHSKVGVIRDYLTYKAVGRVAEPQAPSSPATIEGLRQATTSREFVELTHTLKGQHATITGREDEGLEILGGTVDGYNRRALTVKNRSGESTQITLNEVTGIQEPNAAAPAVAKLEETLRRGRMSEEAIERVHEVVETEEEAGEVTRLVRNAKEKGVSTETISEVLRQSTSYAMIRKGLEEDVFEKDYAVAEEEYGVAPTEATVKSEPPDAGERPSEPRKTGGKPPATEVKEKTPGDAEPPEQPKPDGQDLKAMARIRAEYMREKERREKEQGEKEKAQEQKKKKEDEDEGGED